MRTRSRSREQCGATGTTNADAVMVVQVDAQQPLRLLQADQLALQLPARHARWQPLATGGPVERCDPGTGRSAG